MQDEGISIINKIGGTITGESSNALPIKLITNNTSIKFFSFGLIISMIILVILVLLSSKQVAVIEITGKSPDYKEYSLNLIE